MGLVSLLCLIVASLTSSVYASIPAIDKRIVGGVVSTKHIPYQVALYENGFFSCSGSLITDDCVITAAHCVKGRAASTLKVRGGVLDLSSKGGNSSQVSQTFVPRIFTMSTLNYDVAILKLKKPLTGKNIGTIKLNNKGIVSGTRVRVSGWGLKEQTAANVSKRLRYVFVPILTRAQCRAQYNGQITQNMFCAGVPQGGKDSCSGDSGGPVVSNNTLYGIVSWGNGCAQPGQAGVYTNIRRVMPWIRNTKSKYCSN